MSQAKARVPDRVPSGAAPRGAVVARAKPAATPGRPDPSPAELMRRAEQWREPPAAQQNKSACPVPRVAVAGVARRVLPCSCVGL